MSASIVPPPTAGIRTPDPSGFARQPLLHVAAVAGRDAPEAERTLRLSAATVAALDGAGFARHFVPRRWGGREGTFSAVVAAAATLAEGCTSAAWCAVLWAAHGRFASFLSDAAQEEIWASSPDTRIAAALAPAASRARAVEGGWVLEGEWAPVSGIRHAQWVLLAASTHDAGPSRTGLFAVPGSAVTVRDTWNSTGLRGTGSHTVMLRDLFVPEHRAVGLDSVLAGEDAASRARCHTAPAHLAGGLMFAAPALGAARAVRDSWTAWAARRGAGDVRPLDQPGMPERLSRASVEIDSAALLLRQAAGHADTADVDDALVAANRRDAAFGAKGLSDAVDRLFRAGGAHLSDADSALQRRWRDVLTIASHAVLRPETAAAAYAKSVGEHCPEAAGGAPEAARARP
ncbi:acyl-CoA dehydrogenase family protein [Streptomyces sp. NPDC096191]|uniref:acyl-CoA dehydrogenase family protein n=1 Tax=Streptomyces sp. NPDC096191 TaxID=3155426 RepID=UPI0033179A8E